MNKAIQVGRRRTALRLFPFLAVLLALGLLTFFIPTVPVLVIRDNASNQLLWSGKLTDDGFFAIRWIHSIHRTPVVEYYRAKDGKLILTDMTLKDYGIGMESELAPGEKLLMENNAFHVINMNRVFPALHIFIGQVRANHTLLFQGKEIPLGTVDKPGSAITIQMEHFPLYKQLGLEAT